MNQLQQIKNVDLKAPRIRFKVKSLINIKFLNEFKKENPEYSTLNLNDVRKIIIGFHEVLYKRIINSMHGVLLPFRVGRIFFINKPDKGTKKKYINIKKSLKDDKEIPLMNWDTDNKSLHLVYLRGGTHFSDGLTNLYSFIAYRNFERLSKKLYPMNYNIYIDILPQKNLREQIRDNPEFNSLRRE